LNLLLLFPRFISYLPAPWSRSMTPLSRLFAPSFVSWWYCNYIKYFTTQRQILFRARRIRCSRWICWPMSFPTTRFLFFTFTSVVCFFTFTSVVLLFSFIFFVLLFSFIFFVLIFLFYLLFFFIFTRLIVFDARFSFGSSIYWSLTGGKGAIRIWSRYKTTDVWRSGQWRSGQRHSGHWPERETFRPVPGNFQASKI
jgi:hypothetical protein